MERIDNIFLAKPKVYMTPDLGDPLYDGHIPTKRTDPKEKWSIHFEIGEDKLVKKPECGVPEIDPTLEELGRNHLRNMRAALLRNPAYDVVGNSGLNKIEDLQIRFWRDGELPLDQIIRTGVTPQRFIELFYGMVTRVAIPSRKRTIQNKSKPGESYRPSWFTGRA